MFTGRPDGRLDGTRYEILVNDPYLCVFEVLNINESSVETLAYEKVKKIMDNILFLEKYFNKNPGLTSVDGVSKVEKQPNQNLKMC